MQCEIKRDEYHFRFSILLRLECSKTLLWAHSMGHRSLDWFRCDANQPAGRVSNEFSQPILWVLCPEAGTTGLSYENLSSLRVWRGGRGISESRTRFRRILPRNRLEINYFFPFERNQNFAIGNPQTATISIKP